MYFIKTPNIIQLLFKNYIWRINTDKKIIYLTFDDGPTPIVTDFVLDTLNKFNTKATFFCIGKNIDKYPNIFKRIISENHSIGNHTQNHLNGWKTKNKTYIESVLKCESKIHEYNNPKTKLNDDSFPLGRLGWAKTIFRPPYGKIKSSQANKLKEKGFNIVMWTVLSGDFDKKTSKEKCLSNVINNTEKGSIIVFHDSKKAFSKLEFVLPKILKYFTKKGYTFEKL